MTSSSRSTGYSPVSERRNSNSESFRARTPVRCCPCEPKERRLTPFTSSRISSLCGPTLVEPRRTSRSKDSSNFLLYHGTSSSVTQGGSSSAPQSSYESERFSFPAEIRLCMRFASMLSFLTARKRFSTMCAALLASCSSQRESISFPARRSRIFFNRLFLCVRIRVYCISSWP